jgi:hypothetical protein
MMFASFCRPAKGGVLERDDLTAVRRVLECYIDATYRADVEGLRSVFHPAALMAGYLGDHLLVGDPEPFFSDLTSRPSMAETGTPYQAAIEDVSVAGRIASARLEESGFFGATSFVNYFHLLEAKGEWKIVSKTFQSA